MTQQSANLVSFATELQLAPPSDELFSSMLMMLLSLLPSSLFDSGPCRAVRCLPFGSGAKVGLTEGGFAIAFFWEPLRMASWSA